MGNLILLPDKRVLMLNGAGKGSEGYGWDAFAQPHGQSVRSFVVVVRLDKAVLELTRSPSSRRSTPKSPSSALPT